MIRLSRQKRQYRMKKLITIRKGIASVLAALMAVSACSCAAAGNAGDKLSIVTTVFPEYDWVREIAGDKISGIDLTLLLDNGSDMHSFQPTAKDIVNISSCDVFIYVGGESDEWVEDALSEAVNKDMQIVDLMDLLGDKAAVEEIVEGMEPHEHDHDHEDHGHEDHEDHGHEEGPEYDEHVWLSLSNAQLFVTEIAEAMGAADTANADTYKKNADSYNAKLSKLDARYRDAVANGSKDTVIFGDRFPFRYMIDDYGLDYYAAFAGCSAETEASFDTVIFLAGKADELDLDTILVIEGSEHKVAQTIAANTKAKDQEILVLDSLQSTTTADSARGVTYLSVMEANLDVLTKALA